ncbi:MAG: type 4a pilus biogenesis protein PilO [bacterium]
MNKSNKIIALSLLPVILTVIFSLYVMMPSYDKLNSTKTEFESQTSLLNELKDKVQNAKNNKANLLIIDKLKKTLSGFDEQVSDDYDSALLVFDGEKIAHLSGVKLIAFNIKEETAESVEQNLPIKRNMSANKPVKKTNLTELSAIPVSVVVEGHYLSIIDFVSNIESYQRKINITNIEVKRSTDKKDNTLQAVLDCKFYKVKQINALEVK